MDSIKNYQKEIVSRYEQKKATLDTMRRRKDKGKGTWVGKYEQLQYNRTVLQS